MYAKANLLSLRAQREVVRQIALLKIAVCMNLEQAHLCLPPASRTASLIVTSGIAALVSLSQRENFRANNSPAPPWPFSFWLPFFPLSYRQHLCYMLLYHIFLQTLVLPSVGRKEIPRMFLLPLPSLTCMRRGRIWQEQAITVKFSFCLSISVRIGFSFCLYPGTRRGH